MPTTQTPTSLVQASTKTLGGSSSTELAGNATNPTLPGATVSDSTPLILTKFQFRKLFTLEERTLIDNIQYNTNFSGSVKAVVNTMMRDLEVSGEVDLHLLDVIQGVQFLKQIGILTAVRATRILANLPPM